MKNTKTKSTLRIEPRIVEPASERRRFGRIVHDERGNGSVEWTDVADKRGFDREPLTLKDAPLSIQTDTDSFNPYERKPVANSKEPRPAKRDLRKLSEWIKTTRAVEEKKKRGED